jgi:hypothetical protein
MRIFLAIIATVTLTVSATAQDLSRGQVLWANAAEKCLLRVAPACEVRLDHPDFMGQPKIWCPAKTPQAVEANTVCDAEADKAARPNPAGKWKYREVPSEPKVQRQESAGYDADES